VDFRAGQGAPTRHTGQYGAEAQRRLGSEKTRRSVQGIYGTGH
jgi:hypothetical protein